MTNWEPPASDHLPEWDPWEGMNLDRPPVDAATPEELEMRRQIQLAAATERELIRLKARKAAADLWAAELAGETALPLGTILTDFLNQPFETTRYRIEDLWPRRGNVVLSAQFKAGKTSMRDNLIRVLADGGRFLGLYPVEQVDDGRVAVLDFEMPPNKLQEWWRDQRIRNTDRVVVWSLRGRARLFDPRDERSRTRWAEALKTAETRVWLLDCLGPILSALGLNENKQEEVGPVLDGLVSIAEEAGVDEVLLIHHMGHGAERSRGASRLRDWPDAEWRLVRQKDEDNPFGDPDPAAPRFFAAFGRDVDVREGQLVFDKASRRLVYAEGNRKQARASSAMAFVVEFVRDHPGATVRGIQDAAVQVDGPSRDAARDAVKAAVAKGFLMEAPGMNRSKMHKITTTGFTYLAGEAANGAGPDEDPWRLLCTSCGGMVDPDEAIEFATDLCRRCRSGGLR